MNEIFYFPQEDGEGNWREVAEDIADSFELPVEHAIVQNLANIVWHVAYGVFVQVNYSDALTQGEPALINDEEVNVTNGATALALEWMRDWDTNTLAALEGRVVDMISKKKMDKVLDRLFATMLWRMREQRAECDEDEN